MSKRSVFGPTSFIVLGLAVIAVGCDSGAAPPPVAPAGGGGTPAAAPAGGGGAAAPALAGGGAAFDASKATSTLNIKVRISGEAPKQRPIAMGGDAKCVAMHDEPVTEEVVVANDGMLANAIVYVSKGTEKWKFTAPTESVTLDQRGCVYIPHVISTSVGQNISILNSDDTMHNVHATPDKKGGNKEFNKSMINSKVPPLSVAFANPELPIAVKCDVHGWMKSWIGVFNHPFHGVSDAGGKVTLPKLPAGEYQVSVWHESLKVPAAQTITVADGESKDIEFMFEAK